MALSPAWTRGVVGFVHWLVYAVWDRGVLEEGHGVVPVCLSRIQLSLRRTSWNMDVPSFPSRNKLDTMRAEIPVSSALESGCSSKAGTRGTAEQGHLYAAAQYPQEG